MGKYLNQLVSFLAKEDPDVITMQEVSYGEMNLCEDKSIKVYENLKKVLNLNGFFGQTQQMYQPQNSGWGNAILTRHKIISSNTINLKKFNPININDFKNERELSPFFSRCLVDCTIDFGTFSVATMSWHGAWTAPPHDTDETLRQAKMVAVHLKNCDLPFVLGGDLNITPGSKTVQTIEEVANNWMKDSGVLQTTNPVNHKMRPLGFMIDYVFSSDNFKLKSLTVPQVTISDHLPVVAVLELN